MVSRVRNWVASWGGFSVGAAGTSALAPVTTTLRGADHGPCSRSRLTACTRQK